MIELVNNTGSIFETNLLQEILATLLPECKNSQNLELLITDDAKIRELNKTYRGVDTSTDVLSFPMNPDDIHASLGSIVICEEHLRNAAKTFGHSNQEEFTLLFIHGLLHLLGYDHEIDDGQMRSKEAQIIKQFNLPQSLILRNEDKI